MEGRRGPSIIIRQRIISNQCGEKDNICITCLLVILSITNNLSWQLRSSTSLVCGMGKAVQDYLGPVGILVIGRGGESCVSKHGKQETGSWLESSYNGKQAALFQLSSWIMFIFSFKKLPYYFYPMTDFSMNHLKVGLTLWGTLGKIWIQYGSQLLLPKNIDMRLGTCPGDWRGPHPDSPWRRHEGDGAEVGPGWLRVGQGSLLIWHLISAGRPDRKSVV